MLQARQIGKRADNNDISPNTGYMSGRAGHNAQLREYPGTDTSGALVQVFCNRLLIPGKETEVQSELSLMKTLYLFPEFSWVSHESILNRSFSL
jgi:hypothetical protein